MCMKTILISGFILIFFSLFSMSLRAQQQKVDGIIWSETKLTWDDFKEDNTIEKYPGTFAKTFWKLHVTDPYTTMALLKKGITVKVYALFIPSLSWTRKSTIGKTSILAHEQLHFDIVELIARELRKELSEESVTANNYEKIIRKAKNKALVKIHAIQNKYDDTHRTKWQKWVDDIHNGLARLASYTSVDVFIALEN